MEKVKISKSQAELLDGFMQTTDLGWLFEQLSNWHTVTSCTRNMAELHSFYSSDPLLASKAMIIGYEVEETPEDKVKAQYESPKHFYDKDNDTFTSVYRKGIKFAIDAFNIKIEGIN